MIAFMFHTTFTETDTYSLEDSLIKLSSCFTNKLFRFSFYIPQNVVSEYFQRVCNVLAFSSHLKNTSKTVFAQLCQAHSLPFAFICSLIYLFCNNYMEYFNAPIVSALHLKSVVKGPFTDKAKYLVSCRSALLLGVTPEVLKVTIAILFLHLRIAFAAFTLYVSLMTSTISC